jgi:hypothetical protein
VQASNSKGRPLCMGGITGCWERLPGETSLHRILCLRREAGQLPGKAPSCPQTGEEEEMPA